MLQTLQKVRILGAILVLLCCNSAIRFGRALSPQSLLSNVVSSASTSTGVTINAARIPQDLQAIEVCRAVAFADKPQLMRSDQDFISAKQAQKDPLVTCLVARNGNRIVGTGEYKSQKHSMRILYDVSWLTICTVSWLSIKWENWQGFCE